jgi:hypothetical protein
MLATLLEIVWVNVSNRPSACHSIGGFMPDLNHVNPTTSESPGPSRGRLLALAGAAVAAFAGAPFARAGKSSPKARKRAKKLADKLCGRQVEDCRAAYDDMCDDFPQPECFELRDAIQTCCAHLGDCQAGETFNCILAITESIDDRRRLGLLPR